MFFQIPEFQYDSCSNGQKVSMFRIRRLAASSAGQDTVLLSPQPRPQPFAFGLDVVSYLLCSTLCHLDQKFSAATSRTTGLYKRELLAIKGDQTIMSPSERRGQAPVRPFGATVRFVKEDGTSYNPNMYMVSHGKFVALAFVASDDSPIFSQNLTCTCTCMRNHYPFTIFVH